MSVVYVRNFHSSIPGGGCFFGDLLRPGLLLQALKFLPPLFRCPINHPFLHTQHPAFSQFFHHLFRLLHAHFPQDVVHFGQLPTFKCPLQTRRERLEYLSSFDLDLLGRQLRRDVDVYASIGINCVKLNLLGLRSLGIGFFLFGEFCASSADPSICSVDIFLKEFLSLMSGSCNPDVFLVFIIAMEFMGNVYRLKKSPTPSLPRDRQYCKSRP